MNVDVFSFSLVCYSILNCFWSIMCFFFSTFSAIVRENNQLIHNENKGKREKNKRKKKDRRPARTHDENTLHKAFVITDFEFFFHLFLFFSSFLFASFERDDRVHNKKPWYSHSEHFFFSDCLVIDRIASTSMLGIRRRYESREEKTAQKQQWRSAIDACAQRRKNNKPTRQTNENNARTSND